MLLFYSGMLVGAVGAVLVLILMAANEIKGH